MAEKKGKALVMKLLGDLLDDDSPDEAAKSAPAKPEEPTRVGQRVAASKSASSAETEDFNLDAEVLLDVDEPAAPPAAASVKSEDPTVRLPKEGTQNTQATGTVPTGSAQTLRLPTDQQHATSVARSLTASGATPAPPLETRSAVGRVTPLRSSGFASATEAALATSENLRIAQQRITDLERELERVRMENEKLAAAGETMRRRADEFRAQMEQITNKSAQAKENFTSEMELVRKSLTQREQELSHLRSRNEELEMRLTTNLQKIRVRERELENRLELVKVESSALVRSKDEMILDLKRQVDQLNQEMDNFRTKGQELSQQLTERQETLRRTVKALRIALSMLEGDEESEKLKKVK